ncbi:Uncharacterised protein [Neisseria animaloris]|uniref:hypothetical protein n=1 Tax=Neisseria animaloris TaxID=326522 RepID=UPI000A19AF7F|nr:hypothetical protein [Neisseria animaloris]OSI07999.1 hypothetical protein BWD08_05170 [Neisseria animaloris]VEH87563.1 Uncharacterised protein [Neisseria animaloris]
MNWHGIGIEQAGSSWAEKLIGLWLGGRLKSFRRPALYIQYPLLNRKGYILFRTTATCAIIRFIGYNAFTFLNTGRLKGFYVC